MKLKNGFWFCKCGLRAEHKASIGWACPDHGVAGYKIIVGDVVKTKALNGEIFIGKVIGLDRFGFADVSFDNVSESRILVTQLKKGE
jgi:hypothetical protein